MLARVHGGPLHENAKDNKSRNRLLTPDQTGLPENQGELFIYDALM